MTLRLAGYRVFIASPGGLGSVRTRFKDVIAKYNEDDAMRRGVVFIPVGWEATLGGLERPQSIINRQLETCDALLLVLHDRWGSASTAGFPSNTMEEFELSRRWRDDNTKPMRTIQVLFKAVEPERLTDAGPQLQAVLDFKKQIQDEDLLMYHQFDSDDEFADILRKFLAELVWDGEQEAKDEAEGAAKPEVAMVSAPVARIISREAVAADAVQEEVDVETAARLANEHRWIEAERIYATLLTGEVDVPTMLAYASFLQRQRRRTKASALIEEAAAAAKAVGNRRWIGLANLAKAKFVHAIDGEDSSMPLIREAVADLTEAGIDRADALLTLADFSYHDGEEETGVDELAAADEAVRATDEPRLHAKLLALLARRAGSEGRLDDAIASYREAIEKGAGLLANTEIGDMHVGLGVALGQAGASADALEAYRAGSALFEREEATPKLADALDLQAGAEAELGQLQIAAALYDRAAGLFETTSRFGNAVDAYLSLMKVDEQLGRREAVERTQTRVLELAGRLSDQSEVDEIYQLLERNQAARADRSDAEQTQGVD